MVEGPGPRYALLDTQGDYMNGPLDENAQTSPLLMIKDHGRQT